MVKQSVFGRGGWAQTDRLGGWREAGHGGKSCSQWPRSPRSQGPGQGPCQGGLWSPGRRPQLLPGTLASPARRHITRNTAWGPSGVSSHTHAQWGQTPPGPQGRPRGSPGSSGSHSQWDCGTPAPGETLPAGRSEPRGEVPGQGTFRTALEGRVGSGTECRTRKRPL